MNKQSLVKGATVLAIAGIIVKVLGAIFRIPLVNWIGATGMANYSPAYYIYSFFLILSTAGIPIAISKMVSESNAVGKYKQAHNIFKIAAKLMSVMGIVSFLILFIFADKIAGLVDNPQSALAMRAIAPSLIIVPIMAAYRGYFQGRQNMKPTAMSQVIEQFFRMIIGLTAAYILFNMTAPNFLTDNFDKYERGAAGANLGATAGSLGGLLMILLIYILSKKSIKNKIENSEDKTSASSKAIIRRVLAIAIPITVGAAIMPIINLVDAAMVMSRLQSAAGFDYATAKNMYGQLSGFIGPIINLPQVLTQAVAMSLVPIVAEAYKRKNKDQLEENVTLGIRMAFVIGAPCALGLLVLAKPILLLLYPAQAESAKSAATILMIMAVGVVFLATVQTLTGVLQGVSKQMIPVINLFIGVIIKIIITYVLTGIPSINVRGAAIGTVTAYAIAAFLNIMAVKKYTKVNIPIGKTFIRPLVSAITMGIFVAISYKIIYMIISSNALATLVSIIVGVAVYGIMVFVTKTIEIEELEALPKGEKLVKLAKKFVK